MSQKILCPECGSRLREDVIRCPQCHAYVLDSGPWRSDHNLVAIPLALALWFLLDLAMNFNVPARLMGLAGANAEPWMTADIFGDGISRAILALGVYALVMLYFKARITRRQLRAFRIVREAVTEYGERVDQAVLDQARHRLDEAGIGPYNHFLAYHRLAWLVGAAEAREDLRPGLLEALRQHADTDNESLESAFASTQFLVWVMPSAGFLGTVWGMTRALKSFSGVVGGGSDMSFRAGLTETAQGLGIAFHTTLVGLACVIPVFAVAVLCRKRAHTFLEQLEKYFVRLSTEVLFEEKHVTGEAPVRPRPLPSRRDWPRRHAAARRRTGGTPTTSD